MERWCLYNERGNSERSYTKILYSKYSRIKGNYKKIHKNAEKRHTTVSKRPENKKTQNRKQNVKRILKNTFKVTTNEIKCQYLWDRVEQEYRRNLKLIHTGE